jgi:hypothetical protein
MRARRLSSEGANSMAGGLLFVLVHGSGPHSVKAD